MCECGPEVQEWVGLEPVEPTSARAVGHVDGGGVCAGVGEGGWVVVVVGVGDPAGEPALRGSGGEREDQVVCGGGGIAIALPCEIS